MQTSRREILDDFVDFVGEQNDTAARATAARALNRAIHTLWMKHPWRQFEMASAFEFSTVLGQRSYALPEHFGRVRGGMLRNLTTGAKLRGLDMAALQVIDPDQGTSLEVPGRSELFVIGGTCGVTVLPASPEALTVVSSDAADVMGRVTVEGYTASNRWLRQSVALNGINPVAIPTNVVPWTFGKSYMQSATATTDLTTSAGNVTLTGAVTGALQTLMPYESAVEHQLLTLYPMPEATGDIIAVPFMRAPVRSLYDGDAVPMNWEEAIFEEMVLQWRINTGEMPADSAATSMRPKLLDLLAFENANRFSVRPATRPFQG